VVLIVEEFKVLRLRSEMTIAVKPLPSEESPIVGIVEALDDSITPRFSYGDEDHFDSQRKAKPEDDAKGTRITIAPTEGELVVDLKKVWDSHCLPATDQPQGHSLIVFPALRIDEDSMAVKIDDMKRKETAIVFDVSWAQKICLMDVVRSKRCGEIGILHSLEDIRSFF